MPHPRFARLPGDRRERLLTEAAAEFAAQGYEGASLNGILERAGLSKGSFYYYFDDKADLFGAVVAFGWDAMLPESPLSVSALTAESFWPRLEEAFRDMLARESDTPWLAGLGRLFYAPPADPRIAALLAERFEEAQAFQLALLARGIEVGAVRSDLPVDLLASLVYGAVEAADRWLVARWESLGAAERDRLSNAVFALARGLAAPPLPARPRPAAPAPGRKGRR